MELKNIIILCISLFLIYKFIISPLLTIINPVSKLNKLKDINKKMGNVVVLFEQNIVYSAKYKKFVYVFFVITIIVVIIFKSWLYVVISFVCLSIILTFIVDKKYSLLNGVYDKGIILDDLYYWSDLHSWKRINETQISILKKDGLRFDLAHCDEIEKIGSMLIQNGINVE